MPKSNYDELLQRAEVSKSSAHLLQLFAKLGKGGYEKKRLRDDTVSELKSLRAKTNTKEVRSLHKVLFDEVSKIIWDR